MVLDGVGSQRHAPAALPPGKEKVAIVEVAGWAPGPVWAGAENLAPPWGFDPWTVQPVASRYTDWAIPAQKVLLQRECWCNELAVKLYTCVSCTDDVQWKP
jgi:hypothetical protein